VEFASIQDAISLSFLSALFGDKYDQDDPCWKLACLISVKHADLAIPDPTASGKSNYEAIILMCSHLLATLWGIKEF
jgi:hypothetical protein